MSEVLEVLPFVALTVIIVYLAYLNVLLRQDKVSLLAEIFQAQGDIELLSSRLEEVANNQDLKTADNDFLKFVSDSRNEAFEYIEQVQYAILNLKSAMELGGDEGIDTAYHNLINYLPKDD